MNRQLQANGGIMQVAPREKFGIGSSLKKFVRKIIPNELSEIAVKAAPFVAPFNPQIAAAMAGIGGFDQTGRIGDSLMSAGKTYAGGQAARYIGGAGFQDPSMAAFTPGGFKAGFSSPLGTSTGLGKFFSNRGTDAVQGIGTGTTGDANIAEQIATQGKAVNADSTGLFAEGLTGGTEALVDASDMALVGDVKQAASQEFNLFKAAADKVQNFDYREAGNKALELGKKFGKAIYTDKDGNLDKAALLGTIAFAGSYAEAKALAADVGVEITPEEYDESRKAEKQEEYAGYLTNFFGGQKDGGRIGYKDGTDDDAFEELDNIRELVHTLMKEEDISESEAYEKVIKKLYAKGGRVSRKFGSPKEGESEIGIMTVDVEAGGDEEEENDLMAGITFSSAEKSYLFRKLGGAGGSDRSFTMPQLYRVLSNPDRYAADAAVLKEIAIMGLGKKDGGRIGFAFGTPDKNMEVTDELNVDTIYRPNADFNKNIELEEESSITLPDNTMMAGKNRVGELLFIRSERIAKDEDYSDIDAELRSLGYFMKAEGGIMNAKMPTGQIRKNNAGVVERDYRDEGGFVPVGIKERADDVPAMLSKNEFVMTADAVRGIGNGSVEEGSKKLYNTMKQAEKVGKA